MRRLVWGLFTGLALGAMSPQIASAADLGTQYKAPAAPAWSWTGLYIGGNVGGGVAGLPVNDADCFECLQAGLDFKSAGVVAGLHVGYNWQFDPNFLVGLEADFDWASFSVSDNCGFAACQGPIAGFDQFLTSSKLDYISTLRARWVSYTIEDCFI
jgi:outer membrane immunogenic protein